MAFMYNVKLLYPIDII